MVLGVLFFEKVLARDDAPAHHMGMTTAHYDIADKVSSPLNASDPLRSILQHRGAYGSVSGALETLMGDSVRGLDTRQSYSALVDAIPAKRDDAKRIADDLFRRAKNIIARIS